LACEFGSYFVLDDDVRAEALAVLRDDVGVEGLSECSLERKEGRRLKKDGDAFADGPRRRISQTKRFGGSGGFADGVAGVVVVGELVEEGYVGCDEISFGREVFAAQVFVEGV
jgi:hypothetical protein